MLAVSNYHYIRNDFTAPFQSIFGLTPKQFENQLIELSKHGQFISQNELLKFTNKKFDKNYILITFDDGLAEQFHLARPILNKLGIPYIFFLNTDVYLKRKVSLVHKVHLVRSQLSSEDILYVLQKEFTINLTSEEKLYAVDNYGYDEKSVAYLKYILNFKLLHNEQEKIISSIFKDLFDEELVASNLYFSEEMLHVLYKENVIGSHSHSHIPLGLCSEQQIETEFKNTQTFFVEKFGKRSPLISYPYGSENACKNVSEIAKKYGFKLGFSMERALNKDLIENPLMISRFDCNDMPLGKSNIFKENENLFFYNKYANWYR
jgi:peptidoglycan/xylan/chitin deacetylase (PgdA/CDA1 family)